MDGFNQDEACCQGDEGGEVPLRLEVFDENWNSTVWDDKFTTDEDALAEAIAAINTEGIWSFVHEDDEEDERPKCLVPANPDTLLSGEAKDSLWDNYFTAAPQRQRQFVEQYKIVKRV